MQGRKDKAIRSCVLVVMAFLLEAFCPSALSLGKVRGSREYLRMYQVDPLVKVFKENPFYVDEVDTVRVPRGGYATVQIVTKANDDIHDMDVSVKRISNESGGILSDVSAGWVGYVKLGRTYPNPSSEVLRALSGYFPDPIITDSLMTVERGEVQPVWITVSIPKDARPGLYSGRLEVTGKVGRKSCSWEKDFFIRVYPVTLGESPLLVSNWMAFGPSLMGYVNGGVAPAAYSDDYWDIIRMYAMIMASHRQNVFRVFPLWNTIFTLSGDKYSFDFSRFDKEVEIYEQIGALKLIEGGHVAWRAGPWRSNFLLETPLPDNEQTRKMPAGHSPHNGKFGMRNVLLPASDPRAVNFYRQFLPAFKEHLEQKGWLDKYVQHIGDEPTADNAESYIEISNMVHEFMPGVRLFDAVMTSKDLSGTIDVWVPLLSVLHKDWSFYEELKKNGKEVWYYVCTSPKGNYANRFIELPLIQTRYLHWINYKYDLPGFLHWGLNSWEAPDQLHNSASRDRGRLPAGDNCVLYPGGYRKLYSSIRFEAQRDGIDDYQLLKMLEAKDPEAARSIVDGIILGFNSYDGSIMYFRKTYKRLLELLSK